MKEEIVIAVKLIASDIDDTLLNSKLEITPPVQEAIQAAKKAGKKVVICTGRPLTGAVDILKHLGLYGQEDQYVVNFGGSLVQTTAGRVISETTLKYDDYVDLEYIARKKGLHFHIDSRKRIYTANRDVGPYTMLEANLVSQAISFRTPEEMRDIPIIKAMFVDKAEILDEALEDKEIFDKMTDRVTFTRSTPHYFEANAKGVSKGSALAQLGAELDIKPEEMMAIGDQDNDLSMIKYAGVGVAMGNAIPAVKAIAQHETTDCDHDGVANAIFNWGMD